MQDITKNFTERINRLEVLFSDTDEDACRVVTFDQSIRIKDGRYTILAEDFIHQTEYYQVFLKHDEEDDEEEELDAHIVGYLSHQHVLILLELPALIITDDLLSSIHDQSVLRIRLDRAARTLNLQYDETNPLNCRATMHRTEGNPFHADLLYNRDEDDPPNLRVYLAVDWKVKLKAMLQAQIQPAAHDMNDD